MHCKNLSIVVCLLLGLAGCASQPVAIAPPADIWQDQAFQYQPALVTETRDSLFALDADIVQSLQADKGHGFSTKRRLDLLLARLYGPAGIRLAYTSGHTTAASQTWHDQRGDCLSLTILAYAASRVLGINAHMQEVRVPFAVDRRDGVDFINGHVNVVVREETEAVIDGRPFVTGVFIIDFEPQAGSGRTGTWLTEDAILARFYNNRAAEYLVQQDDARAYAYFRAAIEKAPGYAPAYANLAQLYARQGIAGAAERLLRHALALEGPSYAPLRGMQKLLADQGRATEAKYYADLLVKRQEEDPYYWLGLGLVALDAQRHGAAISALERAASFASGFKEIHYYLGLAYWRDGQREAARKQLATLSAINRQDPGVATLSKKFSALAPAKSVVY